MKKNQKTSQKEENDTQDQLNDTINPQNDNSDDQIDSVAQDPVQTRIQELELQLEAVNHKRLQAMADLENYRRRMDDERAKFGLMANRMMVDSMLEVLDDVAMAQSDEGLDLDRAKEVLKTFTDKLLTTLRINGVQKLEINKGDDFDAQTMEAIATVPGDVDNKVIDVISGAYKYADKEELLKTAKVVVSKK